MSRPKGNKEQAQAIVALRDMLRTVLSRVDCIPNVSNPAKELLQRRSDVVNIKGKEFALDITASAAADKKSHKLYWEAVMNANNPDDILRLSSALVAPLMSELPLRSLYLLVAISDKLPELISALTTLEVEFPQGVKDLRFLKTLVLAAEIQMTQRLVADGADAKTVAALDAFHRAAGSVEHEPGPPMLSFDVDITEALASE